jgi:diamine N-acetyltransferase
MSEEKPTWNIVGEKVALGPMRRDLLPTFQRWLNDFEVTVFLGRPTGPMTMEQETVWFDKLVANEEQIAFTVYERATSRPIGTAGLHGIHRHDRTAEFGIGLFEKDCWGKGYGTETARLVVRYGFQHVGLNSVWLKAAAFNERGIKSYIRAGFKPAGRFRQGTFRNGALHDVVLMDVLASEFS